MPTILFLFFSLGPSAAQKQALFNDNTTKQHMMQLRIPVATGEKLLPTTLRVRRSVVKEL